MDEIIQEILALVEGYARQGISIPPELAQSVTDLLNDYSDSLENELNPAIPENARLLWILSGGQPNAFASYLREFPDPTLTNIINNPQLLAQTIGRLQVENPIENLGQADGIPQSQLRSSNVYGFRFNPKTKQMKVRFQNGSVYEYDGIPDVIFNLFSHGNASARTTGHNRHGAWWRGKNPSLGAALNQYVKAGKFPYRKLK